MVSKERGSLKSRRKINSFYSHLSKEEKELLIESYNSISLEKKALTFNDLIQFEKLKEIKQKYNLSINELFGLIKDTLFFPLEIINNKLTVLETVVKYLKEIQKISFHEISKLLKRDERNIWHIYNNSKKKYAQEFIIKEAKFWIPISVFSNEKLSALETLVVHLREEFSLNYHKIAVLLKRNDRTVWTVYQRAKRKNAGKE